MRASMLLACVISAVNTLCVILPMITLVSIWFLAFTIRFAFESTLIGYDFRIIVFNFLYIILCPHTHGEAGTARVSDGIILLSIDRVENARGTNRIGEILICPRPCQYSWEEIKDCPGTEVILRG